MTGDPVERYRQHDPARGTTDVSGIVEPMVRRRLDRRAEQPPPMSGSGRAHGWAGWRSRTLVAGSLTLALIAVFAVAGLGARTGGQESEVSSAVATEQVQGLATDAVADDLAAAVNAGSLGGVEMLLSPESDCGWMQRLDGAVEECAKFWAHHIAIGAQVRLVGCVGAPARSCSFEMTSQLAAALGQADHTRRTSVRLSLDENARLVMHWQGPPGEGYLLGADEQRLFARAAADTSMVVTVGKPPTEIVSPSFGPLRLDGRSGRALMAAALALRSDRIQT